MLFQVSNSILQQRWTRLYDELALRKLACINIAVISGLLVADSCVENILGKQGKKQNDFSELRGRLVLLHSTVEILDEWLVDVVDAHVAPAA